MFLRHGGKPNDRLIDQINKTQGFWKPMIQVKCVACYWAYPLFFQLHGLLEIPSNYSSMDFPSYKNIHYHPLIISLSSSYARIFHGFSMNFSSSGRIFHGFSTFSSPFRGTFFSARKAHLGLRENFQELVVGQKVEAGEGRASGENDDVRLESFCYWKWWF